MIEYLDCGTIAAEIKDNIRRKLNDGRPVLLVVRAGDRHDDELYLRGLLRDAEELGIDVVTDTTPDLHTPGLDGILTLGETFYIPPVYFDVDGIGGTRLRAVTEAALKIAERNMELRGKSAVVIGRGIGLEIARELLRRDMTVTVCHSKSSLSSVCNAMYVADVVFSVARDALFLTTGHYSGQQMIIDIGGNFVEDEYAKARREVTKLTPRRNGVGVVTRAVLLDRVADNYLNRKER